MKQIKVLALDLGVTNMGYAVLALAKDQSLPDILSYGILTNQPKENIIIACQKLKIDVFALISEFKAKIVFYEEIPQHMLGENKDRLMKLTGVLENAFLCNGVGFRALNNAVVKKIITGYGNAYKEEVAEKLKEMFGMSFVVGRKYDASDAVAVGVVGLRGKECKK